MNTKKTKKAFSPTRTVLLLLLGVLSAGTAYAQQSVTVAVVDDGPAARQIWQQELYLTELRALTAREFEVTTKNFSGDWSRESMEAALAAAYADSDVDYVLVTGLIANQIAALRRDFPKPTFLPILLDVSLLSSPADGDRSGISNLSYLLAYADFQDDLDTLARLTPYTKLALLYDEEIAGAIPELRQSAYAATVERGVELIEVTHNGVDHALMGRVPTDTDAVFIAALPRMPDAAFARLISNINAAGLPSYSFVGVADVEAGLLATNTEPRDINRQARLNALNMQAVFLGERAEDQSIGSETNERLTINMATARQIGLSPSFDVLSESVQLNREAEVSGDAWGLVDIAERAIAENQLLQAEGLGVLAGFEEIARARAGLLPRLDASLSNVWRKDSPQVRAGFLPERSTDGQLSLSQVIYSDPAYANLTVQGALQQSREAALSEFRLDIVEATTSSYYAVLNARSQLRVQEDNLRISRSNLELAQNRVRLGTSSRADVFRWEAEVATSQIGVLNARAALNRSWETLNRLLHRQQGTRIPLAEATFAEPFALGREEFDRLVSSPADYTRLSNLFIRQALELAPEIEQLDRQIVAKRREVTSQQRAFWLPEVSVGANLSSNLNQSGIGAGPGAGQDLEDWNVALQATLPLFTSGLRSANLNRARYELGQLSALRTGISEQVEEDIRSALYTVEAAYAQIDLANAAAEATRRNLDLVSDAYAQGTVNVIQLLDAQDASLNASASAADAFYRFFIEVMSLQRAVGRFDFLLEQNQRDAIADEFRSTMSGDDQ